MSHLWQVMADASANGNALHLPSRDQVSKMDVLLGRSERTARDILKQTGKPPARLGILMDNGEPWVRGALAALRLNAAVVPLPLAVGFQGAEAYASHLQRIVSSAGLDAVLVDDSLSRPMATRLTAAMDPVKLIDITKIAARKAPSTPLDSTGLAVIQYTSGSTSKPKGVALTHSNVIAGLDAVTGWMGWTRDDAFGVWIPLFHDMGLFATLSSLAKGSDACLWRPSEFIRQPMRFLESFSRSVATIMPAPNFTFDYLVKAALKQPPSHLDLSSWRIACNGAEPVHERTLEDFEKTFKPYGLRPGMMKPVYGMAEATLVVTAPSKPWHAKHVSRDHLRPGDKVTGGDRSIVSCGQPAPGIKLRIASESGVPYPDGTIGEIQITGPSVTGGYLDGEQPFTPDRWLRTGDLAFIEHGEVYVTGRIKDMITVRGQNFYAEDVEETVRGTPGVDRRVAAIAFDETMVVLWETALSTNDAQAVADAALLRIKQSFGLEAVELLAVAPATIPHTTSGKVRRQAARELVGEQSILAVVIQALVAEAETDSVKPSQALATIPGLDSVKILRAVVTIEERCHIAIPDDFLFETATVQDLADLASRLTRSMR